MFDDMVQVAFLFNALVDVFAHIGGLFALAALCFLLGSKPGRNFLDWFGDEFL